MSDSLVTALNGSSISYYDCTVDICPLSYAPVAYAPNLAGNALYLSIFAVVLVIQIYQGIRARIWTFMSCMIGGMTLEIIGYTARVQMHINPFTSNPFLMYLICITIAPVFLSAAIYLCLARIVVVYGEEYSRFKPRTYTLTFIGCDFLSLLLQAVGGAIADTSMTVEDSDRGVHIMVAGLAFQVASLLLFAALCAEFALRVRKRNRASMPEYSFVGNTKGFRWFLYSLSFATFCIFVRSSFRVAELSDGFDSALANDEITYMVLEGAMIVLASVALTAFHPDRGFGGRWHSAGYNFRTRATTSQTSTEEMTLKK